MTIEWYWSHKALQVNSWSVTIRYLSDKTKDWGLPSIDNYKSFYIIPGFRKLLLKLTKRGSSNISKIMKHIKESVCSDKLFGAFLFSGPWWKIEYSPVSIDFYAFLWSFMGKNPKNVHRIFSHHLRYVLLQYSTGSDQN